MGRRETKTFTETRTPKAAKPQAIEVQSIEPTRGTTAGMPAAAECLLLAFHGFRATTIRLKH